jgi:hypothetical protein
MFEKWQNAQTADLFPPIFKQGMVFNPFRLQKKRISIDTVCAAALCFTPGPAGETSAAAQMG